MSLSLTPNKQAGRIFLGRSGAHGEAMPVKIRTIETFTHGAISMVRVRTDDGAEGYGQIAPFHADISATVLHRQVAPHALGWDAGDIGGLVERCFEQN